MKETRFLFTKYAFQKFANLLHEFEIKIMNGENE